MHCIRPPDPHRPPRAGDRRRWCGRASACHVGAAAALVVEPGAVAVGARRGRARTTRCSPAPACGRARPGSGPNLTRLPAGRGARARSRSRSTTVPTPRSRRRCSTCSTRTARAPPSSASPSAPRATRRCAAQIVARGHSVQNHSQRHRHDFSLLGPRGFAREIGAAQQTLAQITGERPRFFRAPAGLAQPAARAGAAPPGPAASSAGRGAASTPCGANPARVLARLARSAGGRRHPAAARRQRGARGQRPAGRARGAAGAAAALPRPGSAQRDAARGGCRMTPLAITAYTVTSALGAGRDATLAALRARRSGLAPARFLDVDLPTWIGEVDGLEALPADAAAYDCRNNRLAWLALQQDGFAAAVRQSRERWGAARVGVFLGTSTSGCCRPSSPTAAAAPTARCRPAFATPRRRTPTRSAASSAQPSRCAGRRWVVSTACSSSAKVFGSAARMIAAGLIDAAVVGGVDSLCLTTLYGFNSLELLSPEVCRPWDASAPRPVDRRRRGLRAARARLRRRRRLAARRRREQRRPPHEHAAPRRRRRDRGDARRARRRRARAAATSTTSTCTAPRRRATTPPRTARSPRCSAPRRRAARPRARPATRSARPAASRPRSACSRCSTGCCRPG